MPQLSRLVIGFLTRQPGFDHRSGICGGRSGTGTGFLRGLPFLLAIIIPPTAPYLLIILSSPLEPG
jgi:hypothetical protein